MKEAKETWGPVRTARWIAGLCRGHLRFSGPVGLARLGAALPMSLCPGVYSKLGPERHACPCCGWKGANFLPYIAAGYVTFRAECPDCGWHPRHRGHRLFYDRVLGMTEQEGKLLYFSPEHSILDYFRQNLRLTVETTDFGSNETDHDVDIMQMPFPDESWDWIVCHRVIEHIPDDRRGMAELHRVLKPGGTLVLSVPITGETTVDYGAPNPLEDDHYYDYGLDFEERIPQDFLVTRYTFSSLFDEDEFRQLALFEDYIFVCEKPES